jgi:trimeric autotransporter adhesin
MKSFLAIVKMLIALVLITGTTVASSQTFPEGFNYQVVLRDATGNLLNQEDVVLRIGIIATSAAGTLIYEEDHFDTTTTYGVSATVIGQGTTTGAGFTTDFATISWGTDEYFVNVQLDINNTGTFIDISTTQLFAVPYAMHSKTSDQTYSLNGLTDVDTAGIQVGHTLVWNGSVWVSSNVDTVSYATNAASAVYADTAGYVVSGGSVIISDSANWASYGDTANFAWNSGYAMSSDSSAYADTAMYAWNCFNSWELDGNALTGTEFLGSTNAQDLVFKTNNTERMRITSTGKVGVGVAAPTADFQLLGNDGILFEGVHGSGTPQTFTGSRMVWYPKKSHFYVGGGSVNLNDGNIGDYSFGQGYNSTCSGDYSVAMGNTCTSAGLASFSVGFASKAMGDYSFSQGQNSNVSGVAAIGMGRQAISQGLASIAMGYHPAATKDFAVAIGYQCSSTDTSAYAFGYRAHSDHKGSFVYSDQSASDFYSTAENQFLVRAAGGTTFYSASDLSMGVNLPAGGGAWTTISDSTKKENIREVDYMDILNKVNQLEVSEWNYKSQKSDIRHIGPMAQDFYEIFGIGESDTTITTIDIDGVNLAALKALLEKSNGLEEAAAEFKMLERKYEELKAEKEQVMNRLLKIERAFEEIMRQETAATDDK